MATGPWDYDLALIVSVSKTQSATANILASSALTKTQTGTARLSKPLSLTQTAISKIQGATYGPWDYDLALTQSVSKTQAAIANIISSSPHSKTQSSTAKIVISSQISITQTAVANIKPLTYGPWDYDLSLMLVTYSTSLQTATARIAQSSSKTQSATANISDWVLIHFSPANSVSYDDYTAINNNTYQYRVAPRIGGEAGAFMYSNNVLYTGGTLTTKTQSAVARIAIRASNNLMIGYNF